MESSDKQSIDDATSTNEPNATLRATVTIPDPITPIEISTPVSPIIAELPVQGMPLTASNTLTPPVTASSSAGVLILQWLTYAFWGWAVLALSLLTGLVVTNLLNGSDTGNFTPYAIAAVLVLLPISVICDFFYSKDEPIRKTGAALLVMVIHAVIFALFGIGALIAAVFSVVVLATSSLDSNSAISSLITSVIIAIIYGLTFVRTLNPVSNNIIKSSYTIIMIIVVGIVAIMGFAGPVASARLTRDDKLIQSQLPSIESGISSYVTDFNNLPANLSELELKGDSSKLVERDLVKYTPNSRPANDNSRVEILYNKNVKDLPSSASNSDITYYYTLCVTYKKADRGDSTYSDTRASIDGGYTEYLSTYGHAAGNVCYKLKHTTFGR